MTEFDVRAVIDGIQASDLSPMGKAKAILRLRRTVGQRIASVSASLAQPNLSADPDTSTRMTRMLHSLQRLDDDVRKAAWRALRRGGGRSWARW